MPKTSLAFHNNPDLAQRVRDQVAAHAAADEITQGTYWENGHGCFIGCIAHGDDVNRVEELTGFPIMLTRIAENIHKELSPEKAREFLPRIMDAPKVGADLSLVGWKFLHWCVSDALEKYADDKVRAVCQPALLLVQDSVEGKTVTQVTTVAAAAAMVDAIHTMLTTACVNGAAVAACAAGAAGAAVPDDAAAGAASTASTGAAVAYAAGGWSYETTRLQQMEKLIELVGLAK